MGLEKIAGWSSATNWIVVQGSLDKSLCFESLNSPDRIQHDGGDEEKIQQHTDNRKDENVLLLEPPPHSPVEPAAVPCEIKFFFEQNHEIRQVYVRSTARIYEIYYASGSHSGNEYLCTVRCGIASKEDPTFDASNSENISAQVGCSISCDEHSGQKSANDGNNGTDEEGWVEVKVSDPPMLDNGICSLAKINDTNTETVIQDFFEATAEITDAGPCASVTLRLLSLDTTSCVLIEEIYVLGAPADTEQKMSPTESPAGNPLMAMLVPTLLHLSKAGKKTAEGSYHVRNAGSNIDNSLTVNAGSSELTKQQPVEQGPHIRQVTQDSPVSYSRVERVLDELVCRVGRIETFCLRFEEKMLKPLGNIETRLEQVEQQLEVLTRRSHPPKLESDTRTSSAPEFLGKGNHSFSSNESEIDSLGNEGKGNSCEIPSKDTAYLSADFPCVDSESSQDMIPVVSKASAGNDYYASDSEVLPHLLPCLIVTAPEFSDDDGGCDDESELAEVGCPVNKPSSSLDDALASALAGFLSSTKAPILKDAEFKNVKEDDDDDPMGSSVGEDSRTENVQFNESCTEQERRSMIQNTEDEESNLDFTSNNNNLDYKLCSRITDPLDEPLVLIEEKSSDEKADEDFELGILDEEHLKIMCPIVGEKQGPLVEDNGELCVESRRSEFLLPDDDLGLFKADVAITELFPDNSDARGSTTVTHAFSLI